MGFLLFSGKEDLMGRQLKKEERLEVFNIYKQYINYEITKKELMSKYIQMTKKNIRY